MVGGGRIRLVNRFIIFAIHLSGWFIFFMNFLYLVLAYNMMTNYLTNDFMTILVDLIKIISIDSIPPNDSN